MLKPYGIYKETPALWLKSIPEHWESLKICELFTERSKKVSDKDYSPLSVSKAGVVPQIATVAKTDNGDNRKLVKIGDFAINSRSDRRGSSGLSKYEGSVSLINIVLKPRSSVNGRYMHYLLKSHFFIEEYYRNGRGIVADLWTTRYTEMKSIYLPVPTIEEQDKIVRFLDWKLAKINKLIRTKRKQTALLKNLKQELIDCAVTKSLKRREQDTSDNRYWFGTLPDGWKVVRCKYLFVERNERSELGKETHLSMSQKYGLVADNMLDERRMMSESYAGGKICYKDDLVLNRLKAHLGVFALAPQKGVISPDYTVLKPQKGIIIPRFAELLLKGQKCRRELRIRVRGVVEGFWRLYTDDFYTINLPVPPKSVQESILNYIDKTVMPIDTAIESTNREVDLLIEYRTRLVSDVVTGKVDVRNIEIPEYEAVPDDVTDDKADNEIVMDDEIGETEVE